ncbi:PepSY domain-containing protein [Thioalkalivibrio sp. ARh3]|uniref:PepSY domain-containing protein n=1 Tax=Thioalkalivibrio sp. ARh3 TaxID=1158148 RepID=UPI00035F9B5F|nr:hypothetical protein [Thioalkalivibrio sp. ARh3]
MRPGPETVAKGGGRRRRIIGGAGVLGLLLAALMVPFAAQAQFITEDPRAAVWTLDEAVSRVEANYPGRVLSAREDLTEYGNRVFIVRILTDSQQVRTIKIEEGAELDP